MADEEKKDTHSKEKCVHCGQPAITSLTRGENLHPRIAFIPGPYCAECIRKLHLQINLEEMVDQGMIEQVIEDGEVAYKMADRGGDL